MSIGTHTHEGHERTWEAPCPLCDPQVQEELRVLDATNGRTIYDDRISKAYGYHSVTLTCVNHSDMRWSTKNIGYIGARTIYYELGNDSITEPECPCSINDLIVLPHEQYEMDLASGRVRY